MNLILSTASGATPGEKAVVVVTTTMPANGVETPINQIVSDQELIPGQPMGVGLKPGQILTITVYVP